MSTYSSEGPASIETSRNKDELDNKNQTIIENITTSQVNVLSSSNDPTKRIKHGFNCFKINEFDKYPEYYRQLAEKQEPKFLMFACSDSRVSPTNIFTLRPGEAFMKRNIANLVPAFNQLRYSSIGAVIEYAVVELKVEVILVVGHSRCGGIQRLLSLPDDETSYDFVDDWVSIAQPAKEKVIAENPEASGEELQTLVEKESVRYSLMNLLSYPYVQSGVDDGKLKLLGGYYDFVQGKFEFIECDIKPVIDV